tara:strand:- start:245 stop:502 length:258 start_codon:yes stop_codon:yes gene_type:complete
MDSFPVLALSALTGIGLWFWSRYRKAMNRAYRAVQDSQRRVIDAAQTERDQTGVVIESLDGDDLSSAVDAAFPSQKSDLHSDDAD